MVSQATDAKQQGRLARLGHILVHEFYEILPPTIFFFVGFNLILFTKRLILEDYLIQFAGFAIATAAALIVGKSVLVANAMPFIKRFDYAPLAQPILFKTVVYTVFVFVARLIEAFIRYLFESGAIGGGRFIEEQLGSFSWHQFIATQMWIFVLFLVYTTATELSELFGDGELRKIFFSRPSSQVKATRRARIRLLIQLARLTEAYSIKTLSEPATAPHAQLVDILQRLAGSDAAPATVQ
jgi:hypothetical protein